MKALLRSRKFWLSIWAAIVNITGFVVATYFPQSRELVTVCIVSLDGVIGVVIASIAYEDGKAYESLSHPRSKILDE